MHRPWHAYYPPGLPPSASYPDVPLHGLLDRAARERPDHVALIEEDGATTLTYAALAAESRHLAARLRGHGARRGDRVMLRLGSSVAFVATYYGALRAGCVVVASSPAMGAAERAAQEADAAPRFVVDAAGAIHACEPEPDATPAPVPDDLAVLQYTSGTTGRSKGAMMSHGNLVANALQNARWFGWTPHEVNLGVLPLFHTWGMCVCLNSTVAVGGTLVLLDLRDGFDAARAVDAARRHEATVLYGSATMFYRLLDHGAPFPASLRHVKAGAMPSQGALKERWDACCPHAPLQQGYGLTEASPESHDNPPQRFRPGTVGVPLQDTDCRIADPDDPARTLAPGDAGEVLLRGPQVTRGYWRRPDETHAAFAGEGDARWLRTGDIGEMDADGYLRIVDRKKDMFKFRGYTVSPGVVEECLLRHPGVREAVVVGRPHEVDGEVCVAFVVCDAPVADAELLAHCRAGLAPYEVPRRIERLDAIPRNAVGKPLRRVLRDA